MIENELNEVDEIKEIIRNALKEKGVSISDETPLYEYANGIGLIRFSVDDFLSNVSENPVQNKVVTTALDGKAPLNHTHTKSEITDFPTINDSTITIQKNSSTVGTFTTNSSENKVIDLNIPTKASDLGMTDYTKASSVSAITTSDTVSTAIGKLEKALEGIESVLDTILGA